MVKLRLRRMGSKRRPVYDVVAADSRYPRDGRFIEKIGQYNPVVNEREIILNRERALHWLRAGAQPTDTVMALLKREGVVMEHYLTRKGVSAEKIAEQLADHKLRQERKYGKKVTKGKVAVAPTTATAPAEETPVAEATTEPVVATPEAEVAIEPVVETPVVETPAVEATEPEAPQA